MRNNILESIMKRIVFSIATLAFVFLAVTAQAVQVQTIVSPGQSRDQAIGFALDRALLEESLRILPGDLNQARQTLLADELARLRSLFVITYTEVSTFPGPNGDQLTLDVAVNNQGLSRWLKNAGLFHTLSAEQPYDLLLRAEATDEEIAELSRLQALSGVRPQNGAAPTVILEKPSESWNGRLISGEAQFMEQAPDLASLWFALWTHYFSRQNSSVVMAPVEHMEELTTAVPGSDPVDPEVGTDHDMPVVDPAMNMTTQPAMSPGQGDYLVVSGWYTTDGVLAFDRELASWDGVVANSLLMDVHLGSGGHQGKWLVNAADPGALTLKLTEYAAARGLQFRFAGQ